MYRRTIELPVGIGQGGKFMESHERPPDAARPREAENNASAAAFANTMVWAWRDIHLVLVPIVGELGVAALYDRSLHLTAKAFPWLATPPGGIHTSIDLDALHAVLTVRGLATASAGGNALLRTFHDLLSNLIGSSLIERLLLPVWEKYLNAAPAQDPSP